jgi:hypothetical protein
MQFAEDPKKFFGDREVRINGTHHDFTTRNRRAIYEFVVRTKLGKKGGKQFFGSSDPI